MNVSDCPGFLLLIIKGLNEPASIQFCKDKANQWTSAAEAHLMHEEIIPIRERALKK